MGNVHQERAGEILADMANSKPANFRECLDEFLPGWKGDVPQMKGHSDPAAHERIAMAIAIHNVLPAPYSAMKFDPYADHGFGTVLAYMDQPGRTPQEIKDVLDAAVERNILIMNDR